MGSVVRLVAAVSLALSFGVAPTHAMTVRVTGFGPAAKPSTAAATRTATGCNSLGKWYTQASRENYILVACTQSALLRASSDAAAQLMRGVAIESLDIQHVAAMGTVGLLVSGLVGASWLKMLEGHLGSGTEPKDVVAKTAADYMLYAPFANSAYLFFVPALAALYGSAPLLCDGSVCTADVLATAAATATAAWQHGFVAAMQLELSIFTPYNLLSFKLVPATFRPQCTAAMWCVRSLELQVHDQLPSLR